MAEFFRWKELQNFWNAFWELEGTGTASAETAVVNDQVTFDYNVQNVGVADLYFAFAPLPAGTTYVMGSAYGDLFPVGMAEGEAVAAFRNGTTQRLTIPDSPDAVTGFVFLGSLGAGEIINGGFSVILGDQTAGRTVLAPLTFYDRDGTIFRSYEARVDVALPPVTLNLPLVADTFVSAVAAGKNYNGMAALALRPNGVDNGLLVFDRSQLPAGADVTSATLTFNVYRTAGYDGKMATVLNVTPFDPATVTYASMSPASYSNPSAAVAVDDVGAVSVDVASQVAAWSADDAQLAISVSGPQGAVYIRSLESWPHGQGATLEVTYQP